MGKHKQDEPRKQVYRYTLHVLDAKRELAQLNRDQVIAERDLFAHAERGMPHDVRKLMNDYKRHFNTVLQYLDLPDKNPRKDSHTYYVLENAREAWSALQAGFNSYDAAAAVRQARDDQRNQRG